MGNKNIRLVPNHRDAGKSVGLDAGADQAWKAELRMAVWVSSDGVGEAGEGAVGFWIIPWGRSSVVRVQVRNWPRPARCPVCKCKTGCPWPALKSTTWTAPGLHRHRCKMRI